MKSLGLPGIDVFETGDTLDYYATPRWAVEAILPKLPPTPVNEFGTPGWALLEPAAGTGAILDAALPRLQVNGVWAIELHPGRFEELKSRHGQHAVTHEDFFDVTAELTLTYWSWHPSRSLVLANPPYTSPWETIGIDFVVRTLEHAPPDAFVAFLLPLDFCTGVDRCKAVHDKYRGSLYPLRRRPNFGGPYGSGQRPFAWFTWDLANPKNEWEVVG